VRNLAETIFSRHGILAFARAIGFTAQPTALPHDAAELLGRRGTLSCLLVTAPDFDVAELERRARQLQACYGTGPQLFIFCTPDYARVSVATFGPLDLHVLVLERGRVHAADVDALADLVPRDGESGLLLAMRHVRALDRVRVTRRFFEDFRGQRGVVATAWQGLPASSSTERDQLALLLLSRLMFMYFLQRRGFLNSDREFFLSALRMHFSQPRRYTLYRGVLRPLFFGVLNRRPEKRTRRAATLGSLPYLNGGLFERHQLERRFPALDLADGVTRGVFEHLLERYRFTARESDRDLAVDPEMLGRVFEGLMAEPTRQSTGTFYTPAPVVRRMVRSAFDAHLGSYRAHHAARVLREVRVLDPACGSGAFLLEALAHISERRAALEPAARDQICHQVVAHNLHGVDVQHDAAMLCALRLWLCLIPESPHAEVQPLPNLDRRIRQGDALVDPLDLAAESLANGEVRAARRALQPLIHKYTTCDPDERQAVQRLVARRERQLARAWLGALRSSVDYQSRDLRAQAGARDLFGAVPGSATAARQQLRLLETRIDELRRLNRNLKENGALPFFSFNVHFADAQKTGFDIILCNPPWVRSHNWPPHLAAAIKRRFQVCRDAGQVDLAMVFLERAITLLAPGGTLAIILPAKFLRSASAGAAREFLLLHMDILSVEDHSLDQRSVFAADAFAAIVIARRKTDVPSGSAHVHMIRRGQPPLEFTTPNRQLRFHDRDPRSLWLLVPAGVRSAMTQMQAAGTALAGQLAVRRGVVTGANDVLVVTEAHGKLGNLACIRSEGGVEAYIEDDVLRPLVRGCDIDAWRADTKHQIIFCHDEQDGGYRVPPRRALRYLRAHSQPDSRGRFGALQHTGAGSSRHRVAWHDLASTLNAVVLPERVACLGTLRSLIALNTVYYVPAPEAEAYLLAAYFNSLPVRVFARAIAERAKDAHFRFFAYTMGMLPLPLLWQTTKAACLGEISRHAHERGSIDAAEQHQLDELVGCAYGLGRVAMLALRSFDAWLRGEAA
jgi:type I restriction-modification system DNA methylase subunit